MALTKDDIARIANLARLELSDAESERMLSQMNNFFGIVEKMQAVDTSGVTPLSHPWPRSRKSPSVCVMTSSANRITGRPTSAALLPWKKAISWCPR